MLDAIITEGPNKGKTIGQCLLETMAGAIPVPAGLSIKSQAEVDSDASRVASANLQRR